MRFSLYIIFGLLLATCSTDSNTRRYACLVEEWQGHTVEFPSVMVDVMTGDTVDMSDADFTLLTYIDSAGCTGCRMRLPLWTKFIASLDSVAGDYDVRSLTVVNARDENELSYLIRRDAYHYPVISDKADSLNLLNDFPKEPLFQSMLLDRDKRVIAIGNPTVNNAVADLYRSIVSGSRTFSRSGRQVVKSTPSTVALGEIPAGREVSHDFSLENQSKDTIYIRDIVTSCPCTEASVVDTVIPPGAVVPVNVRVKEDSVTGDFQRSVHIFYINFDNPTILGLSGRVI